MALPALVFSETNTVTAVVTDGISSVAFAAVDNNSNVANLSTSSPVAAGANAFEKYLRMKVTVAATNSLSAFGVYVAVGSITDGGATAGNINIKVGVNLTFATPVATTSTVMTTTPLTAAPGTAFTAPANTVGSYSAYFGFQAQVLAAAAGGNATFPANFINCMYTYS